MSDYFSDKDDQSFDMPNDDPSSSNMSSDIPPPAMDPENAPKVDDSGFGTATEATGSQQQDLMYMGIMALIIAVMLYILYSMFFAATTDKNQQIEPVKVEEEVVEAAKPVEDIVEEIAAPKKTVAKKTTTAKKRSTSSRKKAGTRIASSRQKDKSAAAN